MHDLLSPAPTRAAGLARLDGFLSDAAGTYAMYRNRDPGPGAGRTVSGLSPWLRHRAVTEPEVLRAVLDRHGAETAGKFVSEVLWRSYFKGFLEMRPEIWQAYGRDLRQALDAVQSQSGLRDRWAGACAGDTGIDCFDAWAQELAATGYLHNHARMNFASIWIFTLGLPWELGADFFLRHLLDGDPASNTLSWRWVAGLHTPGKTYRADPDTIARCSGGRFDPRGLATEAPPVAGFANPAPRPLPVTRPVDLAVPTALVLHDDDLCIEGLPDLGPGPLGTALVGASHALSPLALAPHVPAFRDGLRADAARRMGDRAGPVTDGIAEAETLASWARGLGARQIVTAHAPTGPVADLLGAVTDIPVHRAIRPFDARTWPHATAGYFRFRKTLPDLAEILGTPPAQVAAR